MRPRTLEISASVVGGITDDEKAILQQLITKMNLHRTKNELRRSYYEGHNALKDLGIAVPPQLRNLEVVVGWPSKAVDAVSRRTILNGFSSTGGDELNGMLTQIWDTNSLAGEAAAAHTSALIHSCAFVFVTAGGPGDPDVLVTTRGAEDATGLWDSRRRGLSAALSIVEYDRPTGVPTLMNFYVPGKVITITRVSDGVYDSTTVQHAMGVPVEVLPYRPMFDRPFGRSRITRGVRYLTDAAARTMLRTEVGAEFYNAPQRYVLGANDDAFVDPNGNPLPTWSVMLGRMLAMSRDENGEVPTVGQFAQQTMQPNIEQLRGLAQMFAAETSLPVGSLGIVQDNPSSAEAIRAVNEELGIEIEHWQRTTLGPAWKRAMRRAVGMTVDSPAALAEVASIAPDWGSWALASENSLADAAVKQVTALPWLADSDVLLRRMGFTPDEIEQINVDKRKAAAAPRVAQITEAIRGLKDGNSNPGGGVSVAEPGASAPGAA